MFSQRSELELEPNPLAREVAALRSRGEALVDLTSSNPTLAGFPYETGELLRALSRPESLTYVPEPFGPECARRAVAEEWALAGFHVDTRRIALTSSTSEAYAFLFKLLCDPGDEILVPVPSYPLFEHLARFEGVVPVSYPLDFDGGWYIDFPRLLSKVGPRTRAIVLVSPNNPTGSYVRVSELHRLAELGLPLISDEVFASYPIAAPESRMRSALEVEGPLTFVLSGLSKLAALPQMKIGWLTAAGPPRELDAALARLELIADSYLSPSAPVLVALPDLLRLRQRTQEHILERIRANAATLRRVTQGTPLSALPVEGGWSAVLRVPRLQSEQTLSLGLLREERVLVQPGYFFDFAEEAFLVVSLLTPEPELAAGCERILRYFDRLLEA